MGGHSCTVVHSGGMGFSGAMVEHLEEILGAEATALWDLFGESKAPPQSSDTSLFWARLCALYLWFLTSRNFTWLFNQCHSLHLLDPGWRQEQSKERHLLYSLTVILGIPWFCFVFFIFYKNIVVEYCHNLLLVCCLFFFSEWKHRTPFSHQDTCCPSLVNNLNSRVWLLRSPAPVWKHLCDVSCLTLGSYKGFTWQDSRGLTPTSLYLRTWPSSCFRASADGSLWGSRGQTWMQFSSRRLSTHTFPLLDLPPCPPYVPRAHKTARDFCLELPSTMRWPPCLCWSSRPWTRLYHFMREIKQEESLPSLVLNSSLYHFSEWRFNSFLFGLLF